MATNTGIKRTARRIAVAQGLLTGLAGGAAGILGGVELAAAALWGGATAIVPMLLFGIRLQAGTAAPDAKAALARFYRGEWVKLSLSFMMLAGAIFVFGSHFSATILTFAGCQLAYVAGLGANW